MMMAVLTLATTAAAPAVPTMREWNSLNHDFSCGLHTTKGESIRLEGSAKETVRETDGRTQTQGAFSFRSPDLKWRFLTGKIPTSGGGVLFGTHTLYIDNIDDPAVAGFKPYSLQLTFANRIDGISGPYGYVVLHDQPVGKSLVQDTAYYPIIATGVCQMTPKAGAIG